MGHATQTEFFPVNIAILTVSDSRTEENDTSGKVLRSEERRVGKECRSRWSRDH